MTVELKPSMFTAFPSNSSLQNFECEVVAHNIMRILSRTDNTFRILTWKIYSDERVKDGDFNTGEHSFFEKVKYLSAGSKIHILNFSSVWKDAYMSELEKQLEKL